MKVRDITNLIEEFAPLSIQEKWDNSGLCVGDENAETHFVLVGFDCTPALVQEAIDCGADMIVTHHPLIFGGLKKISVNDPVGLAVTMAVSNGIAVYAAHTTADKVLEGVSGAMARRIGLENVRILDPDSENTGLGAVGDFPVPMTVDEVARTLKGKFCLKVLKTSKPIALPIRTVAMCGGSGSSLIQAAMDSGAQLYISGDISYHHFFTPEGFMIMDIGHLESEVEVVTILYSLIRKKFPTFVVRISENIDKNNPIYYL